MTKSKQVSFSLEPQCIPSHDPPQCALPSFQRSIKSALKVRCTAEEKNVIANRIAAKQHRVDQIMQNAMWNRVKVLAMDDSGWRESIYAFIWISADQQRFCWKAKIFSLTIAQVELDEVESIQIGLPEGSGELKYESKGFWRSVSDLPWLSFTLQLKNGHCVVLQFQDKLQLERWFWGLYELIDTTEQISEESLEEDIIDLKFLYMQKKLDAISPQNNSRNNNGNCSNNNSNNNIIDTLVKQSMKFHSFNADYDS